MEKQKSFYAGVFLISAIVTAMQIMQSRIFSVTTWYHLSFIVISIAMFGLTLGAIKVYQGDEEQQKREIRTIASNTSLMCGVSLFFALIIQLRFPLIFTDFLWTVILLPVVGAISGLPYYFAGITLATCLTRSKLPVGRVYGVDLLGAATGCIMALALMKTIDTPSGILLLIAMTGLTALFFKENFRIFSSKNRAVLFVLFFSIFFTTVNISSSLPIFYPLWIKGSTIPESYLDYDKWNAISRVMVKKEISGQPFLWGPSPKLPDSWKTAYKWLVIDGDAGTVITKFDGHSWKNLGYLDYDVVNLAYHLPGIDHAAIIGIGGGRDLLSAKYFNAKDVTAIDVNSIQINLLSNNKKFSSYSHLSGQPGVTFINSEARSWFRRNTKKFDIVQMSLIDTWAATGAGAFALSENGLYTTEAWSTFFSSLSKDGIFTVSRWYLPGMKSETTRQLSLGIATLLHENVPDPDAHIFMAASGKIATLIISRSPLSGERLKILKQQCADKKFSILISPDIKNKDSVTKRILSAKNIQQLNEYTNGLALDMSPPTDMRPFFFNQVRFRHPLDVVRMAFANAMGTFGGHAKATFNLFLMIIFALIMTGGIIVLPLTRGIKQKSKSFVATGTAYFLLIGVGFMLAEISLLQCFGVFLGHPVYSLSIVLFSLILSTGAGSLLSDRFPLRTTAGFLLWCGLIFAYSLALSLCLSRAFEMFGTAPLSGRAALCVLVLAPLGILLGYGFPTGMKLTAAIDSRATAWFWGINGAAGVLSSVLAIAFNIALGIDKTIFLAGCCYALLFPLVIMLRRQATLPLSRAS